MATTSCKHYTTVRCSSTFCECDPSSVAATAVYCTVVLHFCTAATGCVLHHLALHAVVCMLMLLRVEIANLFSSLKQRITSTALCDEHLVFNIASVLTHALYAAVTLYSNTVLLCNVCAIIRLCYAASATAYAACEAHHLHTAAAMLVLYTCGACCDCTTHSYALVYALVTEALSTYRIDVPAFSTLMGAAVTIDRE
eukprot:19664-Heterococcus_DN1.PRE.2